LWAWQFLWILGLWCGVRWAQGNLPVEEWSRRLVIPAAIVAAVFLPLRYAVGRGVELGALESMFDKWHFGVVRLINFAAVAALLIRFQSLLKPLAVRPLVMLGQASLQVFCVHLLFTFAGLTLLGNATMLSMWKQILLLAATLAGMLLTAKLFAKSEGKTEPKGDPDESSRNMKAGARNETSTAVATLSTEPVTAEAAGAHPSADPGDTETRLLYCNLK
jgi:hypothetical protein